MAATDRILSTKLLAPRTGTKLLKRPRLLERFEGYGSRKLTLVSAPAGYGKTVLLSQLAEQVDWPVTWYQLDQFDNDLTLFVHHLTAGISRRLPEFGAEILEFIEQSPDLTKEMRRVTAAVVNSLSASLEQGLLLILDDYHTIEEPSVHRFMELLLEYLPENVHLILSGRTVPPLPLVKLKLAGLVLELELDELKFNRNEIAQMLVAESSEPVSGEFVTLLEEETDGWPAALRLAGASLEGLKARWRSAAGRALPQRKEIYRYLADEVMRMIPEVLQHFVLYTSVLDLITPQICDLLLGHSDSSRLLAELEKQNLFITAMEGCEEVYRYHHLFQEFLQSRLGEKHLPLLKKAGQSYLQAGYPARAVECLLKAGEYSLAVPAIEQSALEMLRQGHWKTVQRWLQNLPADLRSQRPWISFLEGTVAVNSGRLEEAELLLRQAETGFTEASDREGLLHVRLNLARVIRSRGGYDTSASLLEQILPELERRPVARWFDAALEYALILGMRGKLNDSTRLLNRALAQAEREGEARIAGQLAEKLVEIHYIRGDYSRAVEIHQRAAEMVPGPERLSFALRDTMAMVYRDWGDLEQALEYAENSIQTKERLGLTEVMPFAYHQLAVILADLGEIARAEQYFNRAIDQARQLGGEVFFTALSLVLLGRLKAAQGKLTEALPLVDESLELARSQTDLIYGVCLEAAAPVYTALGRLDESLEMLQQALKALEPIGAKYPICLTYGEMVAVYWLQGDFEKAEQFAARCLSIAAAENYIQMFLSNRAVLLPVIRVGLLKGLELNFVYEIIRRLGASAMDLLVELAAHGQPDVRWRTARSLAELGGISAEHTLQTLLKDSDEQVRDAAVAAMQLMSPQAETDSTAAAVPGLPPASVTVVSSAATLQIHCLGPFRVLGGERELSWRTTKARDLFAYLFHHRNKPVHKEKILDDLWPEADPEQASTLFHTNLYQLRKAVKGVLDSRRLVTHSGGQYRLDQELFICDISQFESLAGDNGGQGDPAQVMTRLEQAASLYRGEYLEGLDYPWIIAERERISQLYLSGLDHLSRLYLKGGEPGKAASCLRAILRANPLLEEAHALLMTAYARLGDRMAVIQQYDTLTQVLEQELGIDPSAKTRELYYKLCGEE